MVREKFAVRLMPEERNQLEHMVRAGMNAARVTARARINWRFSIQDARTKLHRLYPINS